MRIIHTADIHLDACYAFPGFPAGFGSRRRQGLRDVLHTILQRAVAWPADAVLIAGDLFERDRVSRDTVAFLRREFGLVQPVPVFIAPGNRDPYVDDSPYALEPWPDNVHIFRTPEWTARALDDKPLTVHGFAFDGPDLSTSPYGALRVPNDGRVHVAVGHGSERRRLPEGKPERAPFDAAELAAEGLSYLALGHFHALTPIEERRTPRIYYSGAPEGHHFDEPGIHYYLEVEIVNGQAAVTPVPSSTVVYSTHTLDCSDFTTLDEVIDALRGLTQGSALGHIVRVILEGTCPAAISAGLPSARDAVNPLFEHIEIVDNTRAAEDYDALAKENTSMGAFVRQINDAIRGAGDERERRVRARAREVGLAAYRGMDLPLRGVKGNGR